MPSPREHGDRDPTGLESHAAFRKVTREITDDELSNPVARKFLLAEVDRLEEENHSLRGYRESFHEADKRAALLESKVKTRVPASSFRRRVWR